VFVAVSITDTVSEFPFIGVLRQALSAAEKARDHKSVLASSPEMRRFMAFSPDGGSGFCYPKA
jgi:hypothetical protein